MKACYLCNETEDVHPWKHPENGTEYFFCSGCMGTIVGVCSECGAVLSRMDPIGINGEGQRICYKCSAAHDMAEDDL